MPEWLYVVIGIRMSAFTSVCSVTLLRASRLGYAVVISVFMSRIIEYYTANQENT